MKKIPLINGRGFALVDDKDFEALSHFRWRLKVGPNGIPYAMRGRSPRQVLMHRQILGITDPSILIDHQDTIGLNNQRYNLRVATRSQNVANQRKRTGTTSRFLGVSWRQDSKKWRALIQKDGTLTSLGSFSLEEEAAKAYDQAARLLHGEFARCNFP